ncbi:hypothetical protein, partial [Acetobacter orientalis]|uniref:hypothetical protein n=1 Tax=Acetobacter orientalis TaxID=146474 RepID=UPI00241C14FB
MSLFSSNTSPSAPLAQAHPAGHRWPTLHNAHNGKPPLPHAIHWRHVLPLCILLSTTPFAAMAQNARPSATDPVVVAPAPAPA